MLGTESDACAMEVRRQDDQRPPAALDRHGVTLHAAVCRISNVGMAFIGGAGSGKTGALLALLNKGASWICDDAASYDPETQRVNGLDRSIGVRRSYLLQLRSWRQLISLRERRRIAFNVALRRISAATAWLPWPGRIRSKLTRVAAGEPRVQLIPPGKLSNTDLHIVVLTMAGAEVGLKHVAAADLVGPVCDAICDATRERQSSRAESGDDSNIDAWVQQFLADKKCYELVCPKAANLEQLADLLSPLWSCEAGEPQGNQVADRSVPWN